jgi:hypothetical protein
MGVWLIRISYFEFIGGLRQGEVKKLRSRCNFSHIRRFQTHNCRTYDRYPANISLKNRLKSADDQPHGGRNLHLQVLPIQKDT